jgi:two-component system sensor histidine kinase SenX3
VRKRALVRRLAVVLDRLEARDHMADEPVDVEALLQRIEDAADRSADRAGDAELLCRRLAAALDHVDQGVVVSDEDGMIVFRNAVAGTFDGARHGDALAERALLGLLAAAITGERRTQVLELFGPPRRTLTLSGAPLDDRTRSLGAAATVDDVSERSRLDAIRRDFVANISHELKTPVGALGLIAETLDGETDPEIVTRLVRRVHTEALRLGRLVDDLLDLSRIEDEGAPRREPVAAGVVVDQAIDGVRAIADQQQITVAFDEPDAAVTVIGDRRQLATALHNLLENAVKYSDAGSTVECEVREQDGWVQFDVRDHGIGIPARDLDRIFERFYRVDRARARDTGGTGLGLAIVRHVADNHGGRISVVSHEGTGSTFTLTIPAAAAGQMASAAAAHDQRHGNGD